MLIIRHAEVRDILAGRERPVVDVVRAAYQSHDEGQSVLPHSSFLRLPPGPHDPEQRNRIICLPAYLGGRVGAAGVKWIASFPGNLNLGLDRASAVIVLNSPLTGRPEALVEASLVSAARTAASAALAAAVLVDGPPPSTVAIIGCGVINLAALRYLAVVLPGLAQASVFDLDSRRAAAFVERCTEAVPHIAVTVAGDRERALAGHELVSIATTASSPYMGLTACRPDSTVLHISLRDLLPETILSSHNVVDDADHVCRERTSLHLAEQIVGDRRFIDASLGQLLRGGTLDRDPDKPTIFSPFGLGVLDLAVACLVRDEAVRQGAGVRVDDFLPAFAPVRRAVMPAAPSG